MKKEAYIPAMFKIVFSVLRVYKNVLFQINLSVIYSREQITSELLFIKGVDFICT